MTTESATGAALTEKQKRMLEAAGKATATAGSTEPTTPETPETPEAPASNVELVVTDVFDVDGRINVRGDGAAQPRFNLLVTNEAAIEMLEALGSFNPDAPFTALNDQGQAYVTVTMDARSQARLKNGSKGNPAALVKGVLTIVDAVNGRPTGHLTVTSSAPVSFLNGGMARETQRRAPEGAVGAGLAAIAGGIRSSRR